MERTTASFKTIQGLRWFESDKLPNIVLGFLACSFKKLFKSFAWEVPTACLITYPSIAQASKSDSKPQMKVGIYSDRSRTSNWSSSNCNCSGNNNNNNNNDLPGNPTCPPPSSFLNTETSAIWLSFRVFCETQVTGRCFVFHFRGCLSYMFWYCRNNFWMSLD